MFREDTKLSGKIHCDEKYESINLKGTKKPYMPRASKPRKSKGGLKRGISSLKYTLHLQLMNMAIYILK